MVENRRIIDVIDGIRAERLRHVYSPEGPQAELMIIEPNGDEHWVRFLCRTNGPPEIYGDETELLYLHKRYGTDTVRSVVQQATVR